MTRETKQVQRIREMEALLDEAQGAVSGLEEALERFRGAQEAISTLKEYYTGKDWMKDYDADEAGKLPQDLKRGVLSEDAVWNLLADNRQLHADLLETVKEYIQEF